MRFVVDTNVLLSALLLPDSVPAAAVRKAIETGTLLFTEPTFAELIALIYREKFDRYTTPELRREFLKRLSELAEIVNVTRPIQSCRDPNDDKFLDAAVHGNATCLISGDKDLLVLNPFMGIPILTPSEFMRLIVAS